jgi:hypothetical protein
VFVPDAGADGAGVLRGGVLRLRPREVKEGPVAVSDDVEVEWV